jgi:hypothetical protein
MKLSPSHSLRRATQLAERIYEHAEVESAYDSHGHLKFLVARIPRVDFFRLYGNVTFAAVFHRGHWIQFAQNGKSIAIHERTSGAKFHLALCKNNIGWAQLLLQKKNKTFWKQTLSPQELDGFDVNHDVLQAVARVCAKQLGEPIFYCDDLNFREDVASIHILPDLEDKPEFSSGLVELQ